MQDSIIEAHRLGKRYGKTEALRAVSLSVKAGTFLSLFGPNGSGKTTFIRILAGLSHPSSGYVKLYGLSPKTHGNEVRKSLGVVSHNSFLYPSLTARENLTFYGKMFCITNLQERVELLLHEVGLFPRQHDLVRTFSRGMQQRLSIARALLHKPSLLLLDEPFSGLDSAAIRIVQHLLKNLHNEGLTVVLTTHNYDVGLEQCEKATILVGGRLVYIGSPTIAREKLEQQIFRLNEGTMALG